MVTLGSSYNVSGCRLGRSRWRSRWRAPGSGRIGTTACSVVYQMFSVSSRRVPVLPARGPGPMLFRGLSRPLPVRTVIVSLQRRRLQHRRLQRCRLQQCRLQHAHTSLSGVRPLVPGRVGEDFQWMDPVWMCMVAIVTREVVSVCLLSVRS